MIISEQLFIFTTDLFNDYDLTIIDKYILGNLIRKNRGNSKLIKSVQLIDDIEKNDWI